MKYQTKQYKVYYTSRRGDGVYETEAKNKSEARLLCKLHLEQKLNLRVSGKVTKVEEQNA